MASRIIEGTKAFALGVPSAGAKIEKMEITRRVIRDDDVDIKILYAGICHSDISQAREDWGPGGLFPMVTGHEIVGQVVNIGTSVTKFKVNDLVGVGCMVDSCQACSNCHRGEEQYCEKTRVFTYNDKMRFVDDEICHGGYSSSIVVKESFVLRVPESLNNNLAAVAPLLCAGITVYDPLIEYGLRPNHKFAVIGLGGLGHMAVKFGNKFGAHVTVFSRGTNKKESAINLGAHEYIDSTDKEQMKKAANSFDMIIDTVGTTHDIVPYVNTLNVNGKFILVGVSPSITVPPFAIIASRRCITGSLIGGVNRTQEMLDFCGRHNIVADIEMVEAKPEKVDEAWKRTDKGDVKFRFVIDIKNADI